MDLATKFCSFALTQAASLVENALEWTDTSPTTSPDSKRARKGNVSCGYKTSSALPTTRRRKVVRLEIKGTGNASQSLKCQQQAPISTVASQQSPTGGNITRKYRQSKSSSSGRRNSMPLRPLPTIKEENDLMYLNDWDNHKFEEKADTMEDKLSAGRMDYRRTSYWEERLRSREECLPRCVDSRLQ